MMKIGVCTQRLGMDEGFLYSVVYPHMCKVAHTCKKFIKQNTKI